HEIGNVRNVGVETDITAQQMGALSKTRQRRREHAVACFSQQTTNARPAPAAMPRAVDQDEISHREVTPCGDGALTPGAGKREQTTPRIAASRRYVDGASWRTKSVFQTGDFAADD
ncbi:MAG TPA: hypothetical protein VN325_12855, partial [Steroidobacteraceae bacterium]|nr:hypothetical protein [Steroidobacteraceae bacterium]